MALRCKSLITSFAFLAMTGCTIIPGSHYEGIESNEKTQNLEQELEKVNIQLIDSALITQQKKARTAAKPISSLVGVNTRDYQYKLGVGDVVTVGVWDHPELTIPAGTQRTAEFDGFKVLVNTSTRYED